MQPQPKTAHDIRSSFETVLATYGRVRAEEPFGQRSNVWPEFQNIYARLAAVPSIRAAPHIRLKWSAGQGRWATVPWIALLDDRETSKPSKGVYVAYLFRADLSAVYLTLNQGASSLGSEGSAELRRRASTLRRRVSSLSSAGFRVESGIDLRSDFRTARAYQDSTVAFKEYARGQVPPDDALVTDLRAALAAYATVVPSRRLF